MADLDLSIGAIDRGARRLIAELVRALQGLKKVQQDALESRTARQGSRELVESLRQQIGLLEEQVSARKRALDQAKRLGDEEIAQAKRVSKERLDLAKKEQKERDALRAGERDSARQRVTDAREAVRQEISDQNKLLVAVRNSANERLETLQALVRRQNEATRGRTKETRDELRRIQDERDARRAAVSSQIEDVKRFRDREKERLKTTTDPAERSRLQREIAGFQRELKVLRTQRTEINESFAEQINAQKKAVADQVNSQTQLLQKRRDTVEQIKQQGKEEIAAQKLAGAAAVQKTRDVLVARQRELDQARQAVTTARQLGREEVAAARSSGAEAVAAARAKSKADVAAAATRVRTAQDNIAATRREATEAEKAARQQERAVNRTSAAYRRHYRDLPRILEIYRRLRLAVAGLVSAYSGFRVISGFVKRGLEFNQLVESAKLGIAALITAQADLIDQNDELLTGTQALGAAQALAATQLNKLRVAGIQTSATTEELITTFQETVGAGLNVGLTLDQIRKFSIAVAQAATAINLPMNQLQQESRSILQSTIDRNSRIAKTLNLTNAEINLAKQQGRLFDLLNKKFQAFNIAGVESVKTFAALKSNIADAFSVFAGVSVEPLFEALRAAGQQALGRIFDFDTAEIRDNFRGLIEGLQSIFEQVGFVFSSVIRRAVDSAEELSQWLRDNRREVEKTAVAIGSMVEAFIEMIGAVARGITEVLSLGRAVNSVEGAARTLEAAFRAVGDVIVPIIALLTARTFINALRYIAGVFAVLRGAAAGTALGGPGIGSLIGAIFGLATAYELLSKNEEQARIEAERLGDEQDSQRRRILDLIAQYVEVSRQLEQQGISQEETTQLNKRLERTVNDLIDTDKSFTKTLKEGDASIKDRRDALIDLIKTQQQLSAIEEIDVEARRDALQREQQDLQQILRTKRDPAAENFILTPAAEKTARERLERLESELEVVQVQLDIARRKTDQFSETLKEIQPPPTVRPRRPTQEGAGGEPEFVRRARAELERIKAEIEAQQAVARASFEEGMISNALLIQFIAATELQALKAERELIDAQRLAAQQSLERAQKEKTEAGRQKVQQQIDELAALDAKARAIDAKQREIDAKARKDEIEDTREVAKAKEEIQIAYLRAVGKHVEAAQREIALKHEEEIREAIRIFGTEIPEEIRRQLLAASGPELQQLLAQFADQLPEGLVKLKIGIDAEGFKEQLDAVNDQIKNIEEQRNREIEGIRARFRAKNRKLNDDEKQEMANAITAATAKWEQALIDLELQLRLMRDLATDATQIADIDIMLAQIEAIRAGIQSVNIELERLKEGAREAFEEGFSQFFQSIGSGAEESKDAFREMVKSIIDDLRRLFAELLARRLTGALFSLLGLAGSTTAGAAAPAASGGRAGTIQRRAGGGPGRPAHGVLRGGIPGKDSIPILAMADEYFVKRQATRYYGSDFMDLINQMRIPVTWARELFGLVRTHFTPRPLRPRHSFAQGGIVGRGTGARPIQRQEVHHIIGLDQNGALTFLTGPTGKAIVLNHVGNSPNFVNRLGRVSKNGRR